MNCYLCGKSASIECYTCHQAWFCSHEHLEELHRPPLCFPIKVATSEAVGRYLVASRDLAPLDLILSDTASPSGLSTVPELETMTVIHPSNTKLRPLVKQAHATNKNGRCTGAGRPISHYIV